MVGFVSLFQQAVVFGTIIMFGAVGEIITEKSGNLNLGVPGIMYLGGISSLIGVFFYENSTDNPNKFVCVLIALLCAFLASAFGGLIFSFLTITLRANQNVTGLTLTIFGSGVANFFGGSLNQLSGGVGQLRVPVTSDAFRIQIPGLSSMNNIIGELFFRYGWLVYVAIVVAILAQVFLSKSRAGLNLRAVGENPATADAAGINVTLYKYLATCIGAGISGLGGLYYVMDFTQGNGRTTVPSRASAGSPLRWLSSRHGGPRMRSGAPTSSVCCTGYTCTSSASPALLRSCSRCCRTSLPSSY